MISKLVRNVNVTTLLALTNVGRIRGFGVDAQGPNMVRT